MFGGDSELRQARSTYAYRVPERYFDTLDRRPKKDDWEPVLDDFRIPKRGELVADWPCVYFVQEGEDGAVKIGAATLASVLSRVRSVQIGNPRVLILRRVVSGGRGLERLLHKRYAKHRVRGEWFAPDPEILAVANPDVISLYADESIPSGTGIVKVR